MKIDHGMNPGRIEFAIQEAFHSYMYITVLVSFDVYGTRHVAVIHTHALLKAFQMSSYSSDKCRTNV